MKDSGVYDGSWEDVADILNDALYDGEVRYGEATYRKKYQAAKLFNDEVFSKMHAPQVLENLADQKHDIQREKQKLFDERTAWRKTCRESARLEENLNIMKRLIEENGRTTLPPSDHVIEKSQDDLIVCLSDLHLGVDADTYFGKYNSDIAATRLNEYVDEILKIKMLHGAQNVFVLCGGDMISGNIHLNTQLENRENVIAQTQKAAELVSAFVYELSKQFDTVYVHGVAGNHSRIGFKEEVVRGERLDNLIPWYVKAKLGHLSNVVFIDDQKYDDTISAFKVRGKEYLLVHGDFDNFTEAGVSRLVMMLGFKPTGVFYGHLHHCSYDDVANIKMIRSGSLCGTCDDYTVSKRLLSNPAQMVCVANAQGIQALYPVRLH